MQICKHSRPKLDELAKNVGSGILIESLQGCYSTSVAASAGTHAGGGVYDVKVRSDADGKVIITQWRRGGDAGWYRPASWWVKRWIGGLLKSILVTPGWSRHGHLIDEDCPNLAYSARQQVAEYHAGGDGLVGNDPDPDTRAYVNVTWASYLASKLIKAVTGATKAPPFPGTLRRGSIGTNVLVVQQRLRSRWRSRVYPDGKFGVQTEATIKAFQRLMRLTPDGIVGPKTWAALWR